MKDSIKKGCRQSLYLGIIHLLVDYSTVGLLFAALISNSASRPDSYYSVLLYNGLAFGTQPIFGFLTDKIKKTRLITILSLIIVICAFFFINYNLWITIALAGIGNAVFHVAAGVFSLNSTPKKSIGVGLFVAPGAVGLALGTYLGKSSQFIPIISVLLLFAAIVSILFVKLPECYTNAKKMKLNIDLPQIAILLFFLSIVGRSLVGSTAFFSLEKSVLSLTVLTLAALFGKGVGGIIADKFGWLKVSLIALIFSTPFLIYSSGNLAFAVIGALFFQMTMPVTLTATVGVMPKYPGTAFGLNCLALFVGLLIKYIPQFNLFLNPGNQLITLTIIIVIVFSGLVLIKNKSVKNPLKQITTD